MSGERPSLSEIAAQVPLGFECRSCGGSSYNWLMKCARYVEHGTLCCADLREFARRAAAGEPDIEARRRLRSQPPSPQEESRGEG